MTYAKKLTKYRRGEYKFPVPPVCIPAWDEVAWIAYIDACGWWI